MSEVATATTERRGLGDFATRPAVQMAVYTCAIFTSALLLFSVQPLFAKMVLPKLGGTPAVWAISMCFFQAVLLAGYIYAHLLNRALPPSRAVLVHVGLLMLAFLALPIGLPAGLGEPPAGDAYLWTLGVLALGVGLPFFAVSANAPLLQSWFTKTGHAQAHDPYFLYAASNVGSLLALLSYPIVMEPLFGLKAQASIWMAGFAVLMAAIMLAGAVLLRSMGTTTTNAVPAETNTTRSPEITNATRALWLALSFLPSGLLVAVTTYISTDLASAPFLWIIPLALFLGTFIVVFRETMPIPYAPLHTVLLFACVLIALGETGNRFQLIGLAGALLGFFIVGLISHRELYLRRPPAAQLTEFYIWMSLGGVLGGIFAALVAPKIFTSVLEFKILLLAGILLRPGVLLERAVPLTRDGALKIIAGAAALLALYHVTLATGMSYVVGAVLMALIVGAALYAVRQWPEFAFAVALAVITVPALIQVHPGFKKQLFVERSFFGTHRVTHNDARDVRQLVHGTTVHGSERIRTADGSPATTPVPATYYHANSPLTRALTTARDQSGGQARSAVVGLGTGSMVCHVKRGETMRFYEIDPTVEKIARDPNLFTFFKHCAPETPVVLGDARLTLARAQPKAYDYLLIDAFSSNAIPVHLMTREAIALYMEKLSDKGVLALHISNRQLNLFPIVAATLKDMPGLHAAGVMWTPKAADRDASTTFAVLVSKSPETIAAIRRWPDAFELNPRGVRGWTDDYSDILPALLRR
jgi:hypothetical protein